MFKVSVRFVACFDGGPFAGRNDLPVDVLPARTDFFGGVDPVAAEHFGRPLSGANDDARDGVGVVEFCGVGVHVIPHLVIKYSSH